MTTEINAYYENAQLAQAAYAILEEGMDSTGIATVRSSQIKGSASLMIEKYQ